MFVCVCVCICIRGRERSNVFMLMYVKDFFVCKNDTKLMCNIQR